MGAPTEYAKRCYSLLKDKDNVTLLDLGCGDGKDSFFFLSKGYQVTAIDFSIKALKILKEEQRNHPNAKLKILSQDIKNINLPENKFDVVYSDVSLHFFTDKSLTNIFKKINNILKPGGLLFIRVKSKNDGLYGKGKAIEDDMFMFQGKVRHFFSKNYMKNKLSDFEIVSISETKRLHKRIEKPPYMATYIEAIAKKS